MKALAKRSILLGALVVACWFQVGAQRTANTTLVVRVTPEAHLNPSQVSLRFRTSADGTGEVTSQTASIAAWVRALPEQRIHLTALLTGFSGPPAAAASPLIRWTGSPMRATGGGQSATCTNGAFSGAASQDLIAGWQRSGTVTCAITFELADPHSLPPGTYNGTVNLSLRAE